MVCHYLTDAWRTVFLQHLNARQDVLLDESERIQAKNKKRKLVQQDENSNTEDVNSGNTTTSSTSTATKNQFVPPSTRPNFESTVTTTTDDKKITASATKTSMTAGAKRLQKVNTKGMKSMNTFFASREKK
jgi:hypothetical protein